VTLLSSQILFIQISTDFLTLTKIFLTLLRFIGDHLKSSVFQTISFHPISTFLLFPQFTFLAKESANQIQITFPFSSFQSMQELVHFDIFQMRQVCLQVYVKAF